MRVQELNGVKVYNVSSDKAVPEWLTEKRKRALRKDEEYIGRVTLLQVCCTGLWVFVFPPPSLPLFQKSRIE